MSAEAGQTTKHNEAARMRKSKIFENMYENLLRLKPVHSHSITSLAGYSDWSGI